MLQSRTVYILLYCFCYTLTGSFAQTNITWPELDRSYINHFYEEEDSYSKKCFAEVFFDKQGRLWLVPCGVDVLINSIGLFRFDGYSFMPVEVFTTIGALLEAPWIRTVDEQNRFLGINQQKHLLIVDPNTQESSVVPFADSSINDIEILGLSVESNTSYVLGSSKKKKIELFELKEGKLVKDQSFNFPEIPKISQDYTVFKQAESIWIAGFFLPLYRFDQKKRTFHKYDVQDFIGQNMKKLGITPSTSNYRRLPKFLDGPRGNTYLYFSEIHGNLLFQYDQKEDKFLSMMDQFPAGWLPTGIFQDKIGNICFLFLDENGNHQAVLETKEGQQFNYSGVISGQGQIKQLYSRDFLREVFLLTESGLYCAGIQEEGVIQQVMNGIWVSSMADLPDGRLLVNTVREGWFVYDKNTGKRTPFQGPDCGTEHPAFGIGMKQQIIPDNKGNLWFVSQDFLVRYHPASNDCESFDFRSKGTLFALAREGIAVYQNHRLQISFFDIHNQQQVSFGPGVKETFDGFIRDLHVDSKGLVWVATNNGLWKLDLDQGKSEVFGLDQGFADFRFTTIFEDPDGKLWLGTYFGGLHIYDPQTNVVTVIDHGQGLSNNTVMSIIADDDGDMWVGTEYGINLVSKDGEVLNSIHKEDGLTYEIFERFDPFKSQSEHLYFGTRHGLSIIDPVSLKGSMKEDTSAQIFLTEMRYFNKKKGEEVIQNSHFQQIDRLEISPERPYIHLKFSLSSYLESKKNRYAYLLEGIDKDWHYLGAQPELNISRLPPGKYRLLIKGADFRNNWTTTPLAIDIYAREFFYKQPWFYLLAALPFIIFGLIWGRNKQQEARRLESEVARRTQKIREDKAVIEQQAVELRQLDSMKSRFFTNISHELRTPITLIKTPLENLFQKHGAFIDKRIGQSLRIVLNNAGKLGRLVEELLELSSLEAKKATLKETPTPINLFCRQLFGAYESGAALKNIDYHFITELDEDAHFLIDRKRLEKIINNLLSNALKFTPKGGRIQMSLSKKEKELFIEVTDSGRGIPPEDLPYIFDRYFQTRRENIATEGGTGIGLALSKELALLMQGDLTVESKWELGSSFTLQIPSKESIEDGEYSPMSFPDTEKATFEEIEVEAVALPVSGTDKSKTRILIVEDNQDMQQLIYSLLNDQYDCVLANNGAEAWTWLQEENQDIEDIQLILSDVMMPEMDGYTLLEKIKTHNRWQKLPVVMLTARSAEEDKLQALRMGVDDYLLKPFSPEELKARLQNLIANYQVRKNLAPSLDGPNRGVEIAFDPEESAYTVWLKEVEDAAREALDKGFKLSTTFLADRVFLSERQFSRKLKAVSGLTPNGYIQEVKLQKARHLLEHQVYITINEVAQATGYSSGSYLSKVYLERFGKKPIDYF